MNPDWEKKVNAYAWVPKARRHYGNIGFTATPAACAVLLEAVSKVASGPTVRRSFELPPATEADVETIGGGVRWAAQTLRITPADRSEEHPLLFIEGSERLVEIAVNSDSARSLVRLLDAVASGHGDDCITVKTGETEGRIFYWYCFGHLRKVKEPDETFAE